MEARTHTLSLKGMALACFLATLFIAVGTPSAQGTIRKTGSQGDYPVHFRIDIDDGTPMGDLKEISGIESEVEVIESVEPLEPSKGISDPVVHKRPGRVKYGNIKLKRGFINDPALREWYKKVVKGVTERKSGSIIVLDRAGHEVMRYNFFEAWPCKWSLPSLSNDSSILAVEEIELCVETIERK